MNCYSLSIAAKPVLRVCWIPLETELASIGMQARVEEVGQALLWLVNDETGAGLKARRLQRGPMEAYEEVGS